MTKVVEAPRHVVINRGEKAGKMTVLQREQKGVILEVPPVTTHIVWDKLHITSLGKHTLQALGPLDISNFSCPDASCPQSSCGVVNTRDGAHTCNRC